MIRESFVPTLPRSRIRTILAITSFVFVLLLGPPSLTHSAVALAGESAPEFVSGDLADLSVKVSSVSEVGEWYRILTIEVTNRGAVDAEPLVFRIEGPAPPPAKKGEKPVPQIRSFARAQLPFFQRVGRPVPAGGKQTYRIGVGIIAKKAEYKISITNASFSRGGGVAQPRIEIGALQQIDVTSFDKQYSISQVELQNAHDLDVDALFLVEFTEPQDVSSLLGTRIPAHGSTRWQIFSMISNEIFPSAGYTASIRTRVKSVKLVDWCLRQPPAPDAGKAMLESAYRNWARWPDPQPTLSGDFDFRERRVRYGTKEFDEFQVSGRFSIDEKNEVEVEIRSGGGANANHLIGDVLRPLRRESFEQLCQENRIEPIDVDRVAIYGPGFGAARSETHNLRAKDSEGDEAANTVLRIAQDRIVGSDSTLQLTTERESRWSSTVLDEGYVLTDQRGGQNEITCAYGVVDGLIVPLRATHREVVGGQIMSVQSIVFSNLTTSGIDRIVKQPPRGEGVAALATIWNSGYKIPRDPIALRGKFEITTPGTDWTWLGFKRLTGELRLEGVGRSLRRIEAKFDGIPDRDRELTLTGGLYDRFLMWFGYDANDRLDFDAQFANCTIQPMNDDGSFDITGGYLEKVLTRNSELTGFDRRDGVKVRFTYQDFAGRKACTKIEAKFGTAEGPSFERVTLKLSPIGAHLLPTSMTFEGFFDPGWGPETIVLKNLTLDAAK